MTDVAVIGRLLDEYHERSVPPASIEIVAGSERETRITYKLTLTDGSAQLLRAFRAEAAVPVELRGPFTETVPDWLLGRARTLAILAAADYTAPRPVLTRTGELIASSASACAGQGVGAGLVARQNRDRLDALLSVRHPSGRP